MNSAMPRPVNQADKRFVCQNLLDSSQASLLVVAVRRNSYPGRQIGSWNLIIRRCRLSPIPRLSAARSVIFTRFVDFYQGVHFPTDGAPSPVSPLAMSAVLMAAGHVSS